MAGRLSPPLSSSIRLRVAVRLALLILAVAATSVGLHVHLRGGAPWHEWAVWWLAGWALATAALSGRRAEARESARRRAARWSLGLAAPALSLLAVRLAAVPGREAWAAASAVTALLALLGLRATPRTFPQAVLPAEEGVLGRGAGSGREPWRWLVAGVALACAAAAVVVNPAHHLAGALLWAVSLAAFATACPGAARKEPEDVPGCGGPGLTRQGRLLALFLVVLLAAALRFPALDRNPAAINPDEGRLGRWAERIWEGGFPDAFDLGWNAFPHLSYIVEYAWVPVTGTSNPSLRRSAATVGVLSLIPLFWWAQRWWGDAVALVAVVFLAVNRTHVVWSRMAFNNIQQVLVAGLLLGALARLARSRAPRDWVWLGYASAACFHTYHAAKLYPFLLGFLVVAAGFPRRRGTPRIALARGTALGLVAFLLCLGPLLRTTWEKWDFFYRNVSNRGDLHRLIAAYAAGDTAGVRWWLHSHVYGCGFSLLSYPRSDLAILDPFAAVPFLLGLGWMLWQWRDPRHTVALGWFAGILVAGGMLTDYPPAVTRMLGFLPAVAVMAALPAGAFRRLCHALWPGGGDLVAIPVLAAWLAASCWASWRTVFVDGLPARLRTPMTEICRTIESAPRPGALYMVGGWIMEEPEVAAHDCMLPPDPELRLVNLSDDPHVVPLPPDHRGHAVILVSRRQRELSERVREAYPEARHVVVTDGEGRPLFERFDVDWSYLRGRRGLRAAVATGAAVHVLTGPPFAGVGDGEATVRATGSVRISRPGRYAWRAGPLQVRIGGEEIAPGQWLDLPAGWWRIDLEGKLTGDRVPVVLESREPGRPWQVVPLERLFAAPPGGAVLGRYFDRAWPLEGPEPLRERPSLVRLEPAISFGGHPQFDPPPPHPLGASPSTMEWIGEVGLPDVADREVRLESTTPAVLYVDAREVLRVSGSAEGETASAVLAPHLTRARILVRAVRAAGDRHAAWTMRLLWRFAGRGWTATPGYLAPRPGWPGVSGEAGVAATLPPGGGRIPVGR